MIATKHHITQSLWGPAYKRPLLYIALGVTLSLLFLGIGTSLWLWRLQTWNFTWNSAGQVITVDPTVVDSPNPIQPGDTFALPDLREVQRQQGMVPPGAQLTVPVTRAGTRQLVTLVAHPTAFPERMEMSTEAWAGLGFLLLGLVPLIARRWNLALWLFYGATQLLGLFLIADVPRTLEIGWAKVAVPLALPLFPAVLFHFHTQFPKPGLGRIRGPLVATGYSVGILLALMSLPSIWDYAFYISDDWRTRLNSYVVVVLLGCVVLLGYVFIAARDRATRTQIWAIAWGSGIGMLYNITMVLLPASAIDPDTNSLLDSGAMLMALATPLAYVYAMMRYDLLIDGWIWRRWLVRVVVSSVLVFGWFAGVLLLGGAPALADGFLAGGWPVAISAILLVITLEHVNTRLDAWLFQGRDYVRLLDEATRALHRFHDWAAYGRFFTVDLPAWLNLRGALLLVAPAEGGPCLKIVASSPGLAGRPDVELQPDSEVGIRLCNAGGPVPLAALLALDPSIYSGPDRALLVDFQAAGIELLLPLVSSQQPTLLGVVAVAGKETDDPFSRQERAALAALTRAAATAAETVALFEIQQQQLAALEQERTYRATLARETNTGQERVRRRIARDLHDTPLQELGVLVRALSNLREDVLALQMACQDQILTQDSPTETDPARTLALLDTWDRQFARLVGEDAEELSAAPDEYTPSPLLVESQPTIEGLMAQAQAAAAHIREICNDLHPTYLHDPLLRIVQDSIARVARQYPSVAVSFAVCGEEPDKLLDEVKVACKQVLEQSVRNAFDHGAPSQVTVNLRFDPGPAVTLEIADNGRGFTPLPGWAWLAQGHHGMTNMRERADLVGGELLVTSQPGQGTRITLTMPLGDPIVVGGDGDRSVSGAGQRPAV